MPLPDKIISKTTGQIYMKCDMDDEVDPEGIDQEAVLRALEEAAYQQMDANPAGFVEPFVKLARDDGYSCSDPRLLTECVRGVLATMFGEYEVFLDIANPTHVQEFRILFQAAAVPLLREDKKLFAARMMEGADPGEMAAREREAEEVLDRAIAAFTEEHGHGPDDESDWEIVFATLESFSEPAS